MTTSWIETDGGRAEAGVKGAKKDCVTRAIAIATGRPYQEVFDALAGLMAQERLNRKRGSPDKGVHRTTYERYLKTIGWEFVPTMKIGQGCRVHLRAEELPKGRIIARVSKHLVAVIDGTIHDSHDPSRNGTRCVYGYYRPAGPLARAEADDQAERPETLLSSVKAYLAEIVAADAYKREPHRWTCDKAQARGACNCKLAPLLAAISRAEAAR